MLPCPDSVTFAASNYKKERPHNINNAEKISFPGTTQGILADREFKRYYGFHLPGPETVSIQITLTSTGQRDPVLYLLDHGGEVVNQSDFFKEAETEHLTSLLLPPGYYAVGVLESRSRKPGEMPFTFTLQTTESCDEDAVRQALNKTLDYLISKQLPSGGYRVSMGKIAIPAFVLQALIGAECLERDDWDTCYKLIDFIKTYYNDPAAPSSDQQRALFGGGILIKNAYALYEHAIALTAFIEANLMGMDEGLPDIIRQALIYTLRAQLSPHRPSELNGPIPEDSPFLGGWRYSANAKYADISVSGWQIISLIAARRAGYSVPDDRLALARKFIFRCYRDDVNSFAYMPDGSISTGRNAMGALSLQLLDVKNHPALSQALETILRRGPAWNGEPMGDYPMYYWYYASRSAYLAGGEIWKAWKTAMCNMLVEHQNPDGSWDLNQKEERKLDTLYGTSLGALILEMCCGSPPMYLRKDVAPSRMAPIREKIDVTLVKPGKKDKVQGKTVLEAVPKLSPGVALASMIFFVDDKKIAECNAPPWTADIDLGPGVKQRTFTVVATSKTGTEAQDQLITMAGQDKINVKLTSPTQGVVHGIQPITARVNAHADSPVKMVTLSVDQEVIFASTTPPYSVDYDFGFTHGRKITARALTVFDTPATHTILTRKGVDKIDVRIIHPHNKKVHGTQMIKVNVKDHRQSPLTELIISVDGHPLLCTSKQPFQVSYNFSQAGGHVITATASNVLGSKAEDTFITKGLPPLEVAMNVTVTDPQHFHVKDLEKNNFIIAEDGVPQEITHFSKEITPISMALLLDISGSMKRQLKAVQNAAARFLTESGPDDRIAIITFADRVKLLENFQTDTQLLTKAIQKTRAKGGTALYDAIFEGLKALKKEKNRAAIVVLTDGKDENNPGTAPGSKHTLEETLEKIMDAQVAVYTLGLGKGAAKEPLKRIAKASGGRAYFPPTVKDLVEVYRLVARELKNQYTIGYSSTNRVRDRQWRDISISTPGKPYQVHGPKGFLAK